MLTNSYITISRKLKALSIVHSTYSKISLKMALRLGRNMSMSLLIKYKILYTFYIIFQVFKKLRRNKKHLSSQGLRKKKQTTNNVLKHCFGGFVHYSQIFRFPRGV
jgi:hypothetical protein